METLLVVDDNRDLVGLLKVFLERKGYRLLTAYDGEEAIAILRRSLPDLVILDIGMPKKGGLDVYKEVSTRHGRLKTPVLVVTGHEQLKGVFEDISFSGFLSKPFEFEILLKTIQAILKKRGLPNVFILDNPRQNPRLGEIVKVLEGEYYKTVVIENLAKFREAIESGLPEFILLEYSGQGMEGSDLILELKKAIETRWGFEASRTALLVYSRTGADFEEKCLAAGARKYIRLTEKADEIIQYLREFEIPPL